MLRHVPLGVAQGASLSGNEGFSKQGRPGGDEGVSLRVPQGDSPPANRVFDYSFDSAQDRPFDKAQDMPQGDRQHG